MRVVVSSAIVAASCAIVSAGDWPQWRHDAARSGVSSEELPAELHLRWVREFPAPRPAWPGQAELLFDRSYEPVVAGKTMFVPCNVNDSVTALDTETGELRWRFFAEGPVRFAPVAWQGKVCFASDDGCLYCLDAANGNLNWRLRGAPSNRKILGNGRLISVWPARGGPVLSEGRIYFAAGLWPFMGVFVYSLDAETGAVRWVNDSTGSRYVSTWNGQAFSGLSPQGYLTARKREELKDHALGDLVIVPCGRSTPASFDQQTGKLRFFGGFTSFRADEKGQREPYAPNKKGLAGGWYATEPNIPDYEPRAYRVSIRAGARTYDEGNHPPVEGAVASLLAADGKLFVVTDKGKLYCFGAKKTEPVRHVLKAEPVPVPTDARRTGVRDILARTGVESGYCLVLGLENGHVVEELVAQSKLQVIALGPDGTKVDALRAKWDAAGWYGTRVHVLKSDLLSAKLPPYLANLIVAGDDALSGPLTEGDSVRELFHCLRPYGGVACLKLSPEQHQVFSKATDAAGLSRAEVRREGALTFLTRVGALPGAADWTHHFGDAGNALASRDERVKAPLGPLWFGGSAGYGKGNAPALVSGGRKFLVGTSVTAVDIYTGRVLWRGPKGRGLVQCVASRDAFYSSDQDQILCRDPDTGEVFARIKIPNATGRIEELYLWRQFLVAATPNTIAVVSREDDSVVWLRDVDRGCVSRLGRKYYSKSKYPGGYGIAVGGGRIYFISGPAVEGAEKLKRRGDGPSPQAGLMALDIATGKTVWERSLSEGFLPWLVYSEEYDVLVQTKDYRTSGMHSRAGREVAYRGANGEALWLSTLDVRMTPPVIVIGDKIVTQSSIEVYHVGGGVAYSLLTGEPVRRRDPLTGALVPWRYPKAGGCNYVIGSRHLLTYRSTAAAYHDLSDGGRGTSHLGAFRSGCKNSLLVAGGLLNSLGGGCACKFPVSDTPMALIPTGEADAWTSYGPTRSEGRIRSVGVNLGAPGDRMAPDGTLWLDYPVVGGPSPDLRVEILPDTAEPFCRHALSIREGQLKWVAASGIKGAKSIRLPLVRHRPGESFSVRYAGFFKPQLSEPHTFHARVLGAVRLWVADQKLLDSWRSFRPGDPKYRTATIDLEAGKLYPFTLEYSHDGESRSDCLLYWSSPSVTERTVLVGRLFTADGKPGVKATYYEDAGLRGRSITEVAPDVGGRWWQQTQAGMEPAALSKLPPRGDYSSEHAYTVRLHFAELQDLGPGQRVFDVAVQGKTVLTDFDIVRAAGGPRRAIVRQFENVRAGRDLTVTLVPKVGDTLLCGVEAILKSQDRQEGQDADREDPGGPVWQDNPPVPAARRGELLEEHRLSRKRKPIESEFHHDRREGRVYLEVKAATGTTAYPLDIPAPGDYVIWTKALAPDHKHDSFLVSVDDGKADVFDVAEGRWSDQWQWVRVNGRGAGGVPCELDPRIFRLKKGRRVLHFRERDPTRWQKLIVTNDHQFMPKD